MIFSDTIDVITQYSAWWRYSFSFTWSYLFQWLWPYFKVTAVLISFHWKFYLLIRLSWNLAGLLNTSNRSWIYTTVFDFRTHSREISDVFLDLIKTLTLAFSGTLLKWGFSNNSVKKNKTNSHNDYYNSYFTEYTNSFKRKAYAK